ncbi:hypothetical protein [Sorangium cellulosum]|uniref:hypothetical protein n=1 Tax=Sorangium cellulosum TaxID=56 RepID=UPI001F45BEF3|nr:hypothetical protein [Sorangium cellulosum]
MRTSQGRISWAAGVVLPLLVSTPVEAYELRAGVSLGWLQAGTVPRLAVGPHAAIAWPIQRDIRFTVHDLCTILPDPEDGSGVYNQTSIDIRYAWKDGNVSAGPSLAFYIMPACGTTLCGRVARTERMGLIDPGRAASLSEEITEEVANIMDYDLPQGIFRKRFAVQADAAFKSKYKWLGARVTNPWR